MQHYLRLVLGSALVLTACGGDDEAPCDPVANTGCETGQVCEQVVDGEPTCFAPVEIQGRVLDLATDAGVSGARVVAVDVNGAAVTGVAVSAADGTYELAIPSQRAADGSPAVAVQVSLRADAAGYESFPGTVRQPLPLDTGSAALTEGAYVIKSSLTDIGLFAVEAGAGTGSIKGKADVPDDHAGILVVAETGTAPDTQGYAVIAASDGDYHIYNLPAGHYTVTAYSLGHVYAPAEVDVATAEVTANVALTGDAAGSVTGSISIVNGGGASVTSIVAFVESTYDPVTGRGVPPPGLRAPQTGAPNISGAFTMDGVPPGRYVMVAAFENDGLVRDPDVCISGTEDIHLAVASGQTTEAPTFKITGALGVISPGAEIAEAVTTATPTFTWEDDSSEDSYVVEVFDAFGRKVWETTIPGVSGGTPSVVYGGEPLVPGMYYQFRATSRKSGNGPGGFCPKSRTEDLRGVFYLP